MIVVSIAIEIVYRGITGRRIQPVREMAAGGTETAQH
jgi:hypothetical protein